MRASREPATAWLALGTLGLLLAVLAVALGAVGPRTPHATAAAPAQATVTPGYIVVQGRILYIDRFSDRSHPAAGLRVEIRDLDIRGFGASEKLDEVTTDANGFFRSKEIENEDPDGPVGAPEGTQDVFLRMFTNNGNVRVLKTNTTQEYSWNSYDIDEDAGVKRNVPDGLVGLPPLYVMENNRDVEALWTFVNLVEGWQYLKDQTGADPGPVLAYWSEVSQDGPRYDQDERAIYLRDADAGFASVVVQQEAYALLHNAYGNLPAGWEGYTAGPTDNIKTAMDPAGAFAQGVATYYPLAVYEDPTFESLTLRALNLDEPNPTGWASGDRVPGRIAGAFWDLGEADATVEMHDMYNARFVDIWQVLAEHQPATMPEWWAGWKAAGKDSCRALASLYQNTIDYNTAPRVSPVPDITLDEDTTKIVDLADYVTDAECPDDGLIYTLVNAGDPRAGVRLVGATSVISITPEANWFGSTPVSVQVSDGAASVQINFRVIVTSVNDCPQITPALDRPSSVLSNQPIIMNLLPHGKDVENLPYDLKWYAELDPKDAPNITVDGQGTSTLTFRLTNSSTEFYSALVTIAVEDRDGCRTRQDVSLTWTKTPNNPPWIWNDRLTREYRAPVNQVIHVDLRGVADDDEQGPVDLEWFVDNSSDLHASITRDETTKQMFDFDPNLNYIGSDQVRLYVEDNAGDRSVTAVITLTWESDDVGNLPPLILRNRLVGKTVGKNSDACYDLRDKATDPDGPVAALRWYTRDREPGLLSVGTEGNVQQTLCVRPERGDFIGCMTATFVVADRYNAQDRHPVRSCWRDIRIHFPFTIQTQLRR